jgi:hypothetical protein
MDTAPPPQAALLVRLIGPDLALRLMELHGGSRVFVPRAAGRDQKLAQELSPAAEAALVEEYGGGNIEVPLCKAWRARIYRRRGQTVRQIALTLGCSERSVRSWLADADVAAAQLSLAIGQGSGLNRESAMAAAGQTWHSPAGCRVARWGGGR